MQKLEPAPIARVEPIDLENVSLQFDLALSEFNSFAMERSPMVRLSKVSAGMIAGLSAAGFAATIDLGIGEETDFSRYQAAIFSSDYSIKPLKKKKFVFVPDIDRVFGNKYVKDKKNKVAVDEIGELMASAQVPQMMGIMGAKPPKITGKDLDQMYTTAARKAGFEGMVVVILYIDEKGRIRHTEPAPGVVLKHGLKRSIKKILTQKTIPPVVNPSTGDAVAVKIPQPIHFKLGG